ncbi:putative membrane protein [candidate division TM7 genomosp. GTL1]|nr:putative membrane protein [candidate division TM7 genomosp. GTL1]
MIPGIDLVTFITVFGVLGVAAIIFAESGLLIGFFLPGDSLLFTAGLLAHEGVLDINIHLMVLILFLAAAAGDSVGYVFGRRVGHRIFNRPNSRLFKREYVEKAETFYNKHGGKAIVLARFIPIVRTFAPMVAGIAKMEYLAFLVYNVFGALLWAVGIAYIGFYLGAWFESQGIDIDRYIIPVALLIILLSVLPPLIHTLKDGDNRKRLRSRLKGSRD